MDTKAIRTAVNAAAKANRAAEVTKGRARVLSAQATHLVFVEGAIGAEGLYPKQSDYAAALGVSPSSVTGLKRLGRALSLGCTAEDAQWSLLSSKAGTKQVGEAIEADDATPASIYAALSQAFTPDGKTNGPADKRGTKGPKTDGPDVVTVEGLTPAQRVDAALTLLAAEVKGLDAEAWAKVETKMQAIITREVTIRTKAAKKVAKAA